MKNMVAILALATTAVAVQADPSTEVCEDMVKGPKGMEFVPVPCPVDQEVEAQKRQCGKDFRALRVGMTLKRFEQCYEALAYVTQTVGPGGKVDIYSSTFYFINARQGRVIGYTRRIY